MPPQIKDQLQVSIDPASLAAISSATAEAIGRTMVPENRAAVAMRWNGYGRPGFPKLRWDRVLFCGAPMRPKELTKTETELLNAIDTAGTYGPDKTWSVIIRDKVLDLRVKNISNIEVRTGFPSLETFLRTIVEEQALVPA